MHSLDNSFDIMLFISVFILIIAVWAGIVVIRIMPRVEMLTRGVYEEIKRVYDALERGRGGEANSSPPCRNCGKPLAENGRFCGACGQPAGQMAASA